MMQSEVSNSIHLSLLEIPSPKQLKSAQIKPKEESVVKLSPEDLSSLRNQETARKELGKLKKLRDQYLKTMKTSKNHREIIFAVKFAESLRPQIERMEREVKNEVR